MEKKYYARVGVVLTSYIDYNYITDRDEVMVVESDKELDINEIEKLAVELWIADNKNWIHENEKAFVRMIDWDTSYSKKMWWTRKQEQEAIVVSEDTKIDGKLVWDTGSYNTREFDTLLQRVANEMWLREKGIPYYSISGVCNDKELVYSLQIIQ